MLAAVKIHFLQLGMQSLINKSGLKYGIIILVKRCGIFLGKEGSLFSLFSGLILEFDDSI